MLTSLRHYMLRVDNLKKVVMVMKNWLSDVRADCSWEGDSIDELE